MRRLLGLAVAALALGGAAARAEALTGDPQRFADTRTEHALRRVLGVLMQQYGDLTGKLPDSLNDADLALREAGQALDAGNDAAAAAALRKAIEALQKGGRSMGQELARQFGAKPDEDSDEEDDDEEDDGKGGDQAGSRPGGQGGPGEGHDKSRAADDRRDPLGRPLREGGYGPNPDDGGVRVPEEMEQARSHAIQQELRRREAEKTRPQPELDYIERLLRQF